MVCNFDAEKCSTQCPKYAMCTFRATQEQISHLYESINGLAAIITNLCSDNLEIKENLNNYTINMLDLINEISNKETTEYEKN